MNTMTDGDPDRGVADVLLGALAGSTLLPLVQAIATKSGEDVYAKLKRVLSKRERDKAKAEIKETGTLTLVSEEARVVLRIPATMTLPMAQQLERVRVRPDPATWVRVSWDHTRSRWLVHECDPPHGTQH
ncbi:hypothetical protein SAMN05421630_110120 [Prauserella marina]|uniref:Uncharacterized protein n=2 Tax=Prauserella marina TaxID=530584 RepID=A0A1G6W1A7_9PSEU|nr:hypothetical protein DES30_108120 [Prauserella marina]SDD59564.1 hypothetical protein SAMN05421630_110120 [Prauserella marina]